SVPKKFSIAALFRPFPLCGIFCATPWGFNFAYSLPFDIANPDPYVATGHPPGRALTMHRAPSY
ncbi:hypothetical protein E8Y33_RS27850, partial [Escherichia coli]